MHGDSSIWTELYGTSFSHDDLHSRSQWHGVAKAVRMISYVRGVSASGPSSKFVMNIMSVSNCSSFSAFMDLYVM